ncbi:MAG: hypothetical protein ABIK28_10235 [Planctomycetota bacterium]
MLFLWLWVPVFIDFSCVFGAPFQEEKVQEEAPAPTQVSEAEKKLDEEIEAARITLAGLNDQVRSERLARVKKIDAMRREVQSLQAEQAELERHENRLQIDIEKVSREVIHLKEVADFLKEPVVEYCRSFETQISLPEQQNYRKTFEHLDDLLR